MELAAPHTAIAEAWLVLPKTTLYAGFGGSKVDPVRVHRLPLPPIHPKAKVLSDTTSQFSVVLKLIMPGKITLNTPQSVGEDAGLLLRFEPTLDK